jgi:hypothetical protein
MDLGFREWEGQSFVFCQNSIPFPHFTTFTSIMWQNPQYWEKGHIQTKQYGETNQKASLIFTKNSFTTFLEGDYLLGYVFFFTICMLIYFSNWILAKNGYVGHHKYLTIIFLQIVWLLNCMCM